jgi:S-DNA-T family DNA segregation ATPase FtsK/SpoIIIE
VSLPEHHLLVAGETGGGKSGVLQMVVAWAAFDPSVRLVLFDFKRVELRPWARCAERFVSWDVEEATGVLRELRAECTKRLDAMDAAPGIKRKVERGDGMGLVLVVIDELALYCEEPDGLGKAFAAELRRLVQVCRAAGIIVVAATQKPSADVVPTSLRDLFGFRMALRCSTRDASDTILGAGWASQGYSAASIDAACRGVGFLLAEGGVPVRMKACYLTDLDLRSLAARAEALRSGEDPPDESGAMLPVA